MNRKEKIEFLNCVLKGVKRIQELRNSDYLLMINTNGIPNQYFKNGKIIEQEQYEYETKDFKEIKVSVRDEN